MYFTRRQALKSVAAAAAATLLADASPATEPDLDPFPPLPAAPTPGKPGDFAFLTGEWRISHRLRGATGAWAAFDGQATVYAILGGIGSVEELRIPARNFSGMGLRLLDLEKRAWSDFWVSGQSGILATPGQAGSFEGGVGIFHSEEVEDGKPVIHAGAWDRITATGCRWRQASSRDQGRSWQQTWLMDWSRVRRLPRAAAAP